MNSDWDRLHILAEYHNYSHDENAAQPANEFEPAEN